MFRPAIALAAAVLVLVLLATGCGSSDDGGAAVKTTSDYAGGAQAAAPAPAKSPKPAAQAPVTADAAPAAKPLAVGVGDNFFKPATVHAKVGQKVTWTLNGAVSHTVTASAGATFDSGALKPGQSFSWTPKQAGTVAYLCSFHAGMTGTIVVE